MIKNPRLAALLGGVIFVQVVAPALGHPGSGIVVDRQGLVYFTDTGHGVWKIDERGQLKSHGGQAFHWMTVDVDGRFAKTRWPAFAEPSAEIQRVGDKPTLLVASDFPLTVSRDGTLYYPDLGRDQRVQVVRLVPSGNRSVLATLPAVSDNGPLPGPETA